MKEFDFSSINKSTLLLIFVLMLLVNIRADEADHQKDKIKKGEEEMAKADIKGPLPSEKPNEGQKAMIARRYGMFIHFGINTFHDEEWTDGSKPANSYNPKTLDVKQWVTVAREAGMNCVIQVTKHIDGFCLWDSPMTTYDIGSSPNPTNVVDALASECKKQGIGYGIYYALWDRKQNPNSKEPKDDMAYNQYTLKQIEELMLIAGKHGPGVELWLDGSWVKPNTRWPLEEIYACVKKLQPQCQISTNWTIGFPDKIDDMCHSSQQKEGFPIRYFPSDFRLGDPELPNNPDPKIFTHDGKKYYLPWESTVCLSEKWFFNTKDHKYKTLDDLEKLYIRATAQDNILIFNCPPNREGQMREIDAKILKDLGEKLGISPKH